MVDHPEDDGVPSDIDDDAASRKIGHDFVRLRRTARRKQRQSCNDKKLYAHRSLSNAP